MNPILPDGIILFKTGRQKMKMTHVCVITEDVKELSEFYSKALKIEPDFYGDYAEFPTEGGILSLFDIVAHEKLAEGSSVPKSNRCVELEFNVEDVDLEYARLKEMGVEIVKPLTTQPWGNRSFYFRDPDGNLVNFYSRV